MKCRGFCWKLIGLSALFFLFVPFLLNIVLGWHSPNNIKVIGTATDWLLFHGSYIGGVLTAVVGFIVMGIESRRNGYALRLKNQQAYIKSLEAELSNLIGAMQFYEIGDISLYVSDKKNFKFHSVVAIGRLNDKLGIVMNQANTFMLGYRGRSEEYINKFVVLYENCVKAYQESVNEMTRLLFGVREFMSDAEWDNFCQKITGINEKAAKGQEYLKSVYEAADNWLVAERNKEADLQNKLKRLGFDFD